MEASSSTSAPPPPPTHSLLGNIETKLSPGVLIIIAILAMVLFIFGLLNLLVQNLLRLRRNRRRRGRRRVGVDDVDGSPTAFQGQLQQLFHLHDAGVDQAFIDALPVFVYRAVVGASGCAGHKDDPFDCAVCLCEFGMDDKLRLLPTCGHAFHVPCIDAWLLSHSTCPLCRGSILAAELSPASSPVVLVIESEIRAETARDGEAPRGVDDEVSPKAEEIVEVKLGKLRCVDGNGDSGELAVETNGRSNGDGVGNLGQRRCLSMGSYEYVMDEHAALRVAIKTPKRRPPSATSRRRFALSECDFGSAKKGAWETAAAASADAGRCGDGDTTATARLNKDSFSVSKIWMVPAKKGDGQTAELAAGRRAVSFRWPAALSKKQGGHEDHRDMEAGSGGDNGVSSLAEERRTTTLLWVVGGRQQSSRAGSHS